METSEIDLKLEMLDRFTDKLALLVQVALFIAMLAWWVKTYMV